MKLFRRAAPVLPCRTLAHALCAFQNITFPMDASQLAISVAEIHHGTYVNFETDKEGGDRLPVDGPSQCVFFINRKTTQKRQEGEIKGISLTCHLLFAIFAFFRLTSLIRTYMEVSVLITEGRIQGLRL